MLQYLHINTVVHQTIQLIISLFQQVMEVGKDTTGNVLIGLVNIFQG